MSEGYGSTNLRAYLLVRLRADERMRDNGRLGKADLFCLPLCMPGWHNAPSKDVAREG
jgi:hypothetical protein